MVLSHHQQSEKIDCWQSVLQIMQEASSIIKKLGGFMYNHTSLYQVALLIAPLPTHTELGAPSSAGQAGLLLPAVSPQLEGDLQRMQT